MAIIPESQYPGKVNPADAEYPYGSARNITSPGDGTGYPWEAAGVRDWQGFFQSVLVAANVVPNGAPDRVGAAQYLQALQKIGVFRWSAQPTYQVGAVVLGSDNELYIAELEQAGNNPVGDDGTNWGVYISRQLLSNLKNAAKASRVKQKLDFDQGPVYVLCQGDSTGDADNEWFRRMAEKMSVRYPSYTFRYVKWNHAGNSWDAPVTLSAGTGPNTIDFYNGSFSGATHGYWTGNRNPLAYDGKKFDAIISNYGLNVPTSWRSQAEQLAEYLFTLRQQQPSAEVLVTVQSPDYNILDRSALRADAQRYVAGLYGCQVIDIFNLFVTLVASTGGDTAPWYVDDIHPTVAGSNRWADAALNNLEYDYAGGAGTHRAIQASPSKLPNGNFISWLNGNSDVPTFWVAGPGQTTLRNTVQYETGGASVRSSGVGVGTGTLYLDGIDKVFEKFKHWGQMVVAARVYSQSSGVNSGKCGKLFAAHSVSTSYTEIQSTQGLPGYVDSAWRWVFLLIDNDFIEGNSDFRIGVFTGEAGELCSVDRIVISPTLFIDESDGSTSWKFRQELSDGAFSVVASSVVNRTFSAFTIPVQPGCKIEAIPLDAPSSLLFDAHSTADGVVIVRIANPSAAPVNMPATTYTFIVSTNE